MQLTQKHRFLKISPILLLILAQGVYLLVGLLWLNFKVDWISVIATIATAVLTEISLCYLTNKKIHSINSSLAVAFGILIFLRVTSLHYYIFAAFLAILSKYTIRLFGKHIFNPSNFAMTVLVVLFPFAAGIEFTQWGNNVFVLLAISATALSVTYYARKLTTSISFLVTYGAGFLLLLPYFPQMLPAHHYGLLGPSLVIFAAFMITDPQTSPQGKWASILHGVSIALIYFVLEIYGIRYSLFIASFLVTVLNASFLIIRQFIPLIGRLCKKVIINSESTLIISVLFISVFLGVVTTISKDISIFHLSPNFLLFGVESDTLFQCNDKNVSLQSLKNTGFARPSLTTGAAWGDYNNDGFEDLFVSSLTGTSILYRNNGGDGTFTDVTSNVNLPNKTSSSAFFVDYNNDNNLDLFIVYYTDTKRTFRMSTKKVQAISVFRNTGNGTFVDVTKKVGLDTFKMEDSIGTLSFADYNLDGYIDMVFTSRGQSIGMGIHKNVGISEKEGSLRKIFGDPFFNPTSSIECRSSEIKRNSKELKKNYPYLKRPEISKMLTSGTCTLTDDLVLREANPRSLYFKNIGQYKKTLALTLHRKGSVHIFENVKGVFVEHPDFSKQIKQYMDNTSYTYKDGLFPFDFISGRFYQPLSFDYNNDGLPDIFIAIDYGSSLLLKNKGGFNFENTTEKAGLDYARSGMGADSGDYNNDGYTDILMSSTREDSLYINNGDETFTRFKKQFSRIGIGWGISFLDYDSDGKKDIFIVNGDFTNYYQNFPRFDLVRPIFRSDILYKNYGNKFKNVTGDAICSDYQSGKTLAVGDYNNDGHQDVFVGTISNPKKGRGENILYKNINTKNNFIGIFLKGTKSNSMGIGARVSVKNSDTVQYQEMTLGSGFYAQNGRTILFGLGTNQSTVSISVKWPSGKVTQIKNLKINKVYTITE